MGYSPYTATHVITQLQLLLFSALAFAVLMRTGLYPAELRSVNLDWDWTYRRLLPGFVRRVRQWYGRLGPALTERTEQHLQALIRWLYRQHGPQGYLARTWPTGSMVLWVAVLLSTCLIFYYL